MELQWVKKMEQIQTGTDDTGHQTLDGKDDQNTKNMKYRKVRLACRVAVEGRSSSVFHGNRLRWTLDLGWVWYIRV